MAIWKEHSWMNQAELPCNYEYDLIYGVFACIIFFENNQISNCYIDTRWRFLGGRKQRWEGYGVCVVLETGVGGEGDCVSGYRGDKEAW